MFLAAFKLLLPVPVIIGLAVASEQSQGFFSQHQDATQWIIGTLFLALIGSVGLQWRGVLREQKEMKREFTEAQRTVVESMKTIAKRVEDVCIEQAVMKQHCKDVCAFRQDGG